MKSNKTVEKEDQIPKKSRLRENIEAILVAIVLALFIRTFVVQAFKIPSGSMKETLQIGDHILVNKFLYGIKVPFVGKQIVPITDPKHGDIIVFRYPEDPDKDYIKRVIAIAGDVVEGREKKIFINNKPSNPGYGVHKDPHIIPAGLQPRDNFGPIAVPANSLFVMGDNRDYSYDSRYWGFVELNEVKGKAFIIYWSWDKDNFGVRWRRLGKMLK